MTLGASCNRCNDSVERPTGSGQQDNSLQKSHGSFNSLLEISAAGNSTRRGVVSLCLDSVEKMSHLSPSSGVSPGATTPQSAGFSPPLVPGTPTSTSTTRSSMFRLPDELPAGIVGTPDRPQSGCHPRRPSNASGSMARLPPDDTPLVQDGRRTSASSRSGSQSGSNMATERRPSFSLLRLPSEILNAPALLASSGTPESPLSPLSLVTTNFPNLEKAAVSSPLSPSGSESSVSVPTSPLSSLTSPVKTDGETPPQKPIKSSALRDRFNKNLTVATDNLVPASAKTSPARTVFRQLKEGERVQDYYLCAEEIYSGGSKGKVVVAKRKKDDAEVIMKIRTKRSNKGGERAWRSIMTQMGQMGGSQHVLEIYEILEDDSAFYIIMPRCNGGELFEFLVTETEVPESECKRIIREILIAVGHLHKSGLVHRDVKPENIMFQLVDKEPGNSPKTVKLIDFDTCMEWTPASPKTNRFVGTPGYIAPEALLGEVTPLSDLWSIGVILYILMTGETPWSSMISLEDGTVGSPGAKKMYENLKAESFEWDKEPWPDFPLARDLCQKLMAFNMQERPQSVAVVLAHQWLNT